ncbi:MAG: spore germination protein [Oscillospiraceae bacterium]
MQKSQSDRHEDSYDTLIRSIDARLHIGVSFDLVMRELTLGRRRARLYFVDGLVKDDALLKILTPLLAVKPADLDSLPNAQSFAKHLIPYIEVSCENDLDTVVTQVLSGPSALVVEGFQDVILIDARTYPVRSLQEPDSDRVLRGARDSFVETLVFNTALIRRRIRDTRLVMRYYAIGNTSKTDVVLCYLDGRADHEALAKLTTKLEKIKVKSLSLTQESLAEVLIDRGWYNPFPKVRYTERPDAAAATVCEGGLVLIVDGTPSVMLLPTAFFDFFQETNDYYFPPLTGSYLRIVRYLIYFLTLLLIPTWYLLVRNPTWVPPWLHFILVEKMNEIPIFVQLMVVELVIDCLKQASLNTPSALGGSFSVVAAMILGEFAVTARWFVPEVLLYMAFVAVANFATPSFELGYALKLSRMMLLVLVALFNLWGYLSGLAILMVLIATTPTPTGQSYLAPLIPFNGEKLLRLLVRRRMNDGNS